MQGSLFGNLVLQNASHLATARWLRPGSANVRVVLCCCKFLVSYCCLAVNPTCHSAVLAVNPERHFLQYAATLTCLVVRFWLCLELAGLVRKLHLLLALLTVFTACAAFAFQSSTDLLLGLCRA